MNDREKREAAGQWLRDARKRAGYDSLGAFARALEIDPSQVSRYELGASTVPDDRAERIAEVLGRPVLEVRRRLGLWVPGPMDAAETMLDENERLVAEIGALSERGRQAVEAFIDAIKEASEIPGGRGNPQR